MRTPSGYEEIVRTFGDIRAYIHRDGTLDPKWEAHELALCPLPAELALGWEPSRLISRIRCHRLLVEQFRAAYDSIHAAGLWPELRTFDGCYNFRPQRGSPSKISVHAFGAAVDHAAATNELGTKGDMHPGIIQCFEAVGFLWGGRFVRPDPMHFQFAKAY